MRASRATRGSVWTYAFLGLVLAFCLSLPACKYFRPSKVSSCKSSNTTTVHVNRKAAKGVDEDPVYIYPGNCVNWKERDGEQWNWILKDQSVSPFLSGETKLKKGDADPGPAIPVGHNSKSFPYTITVDGTSYDPQIIIMGGT